MKKNSTQTWIIVLSILAITMAFALLMSKKNQSGPEKSLEFEYQQAKMAAQSSPITTPLPTVETVIPTAVSSEYQYVIQIISLSDQMKAEGVLTKLTSAGFTGYVAKTDLGQKGVTYRVFVGPFISKDDAATKLPDVKAIYKDAFILRI
ncbi:MAG: SPOR domain-containing protein [Candidatus Omnitrophica bacterium]|nr:SPOR domain-containing protein [Candidatus Omnitrophota bacterium]